MADPMQPPKPQAPAPMAPKPPAPNQFDAMRRRMASTNQMQLNKAQGQQGEALNRKFASAGIANSGAAIRAQQVGDQEMQQQFAEQLGQQQGAVDQMEAGQAFQSDEAQKARDFQGGQFDQTFALDSELKRAQLGLAGQEMDLKRQEQSFNMGGNLADRGYGVDLTQLAPTDFRDAHTGRLINPNGRGLAYEKYNNDGVYSDAGQQEAEERQRFLYGVRQSVGNSVGRR